MTDHRAEMATFMFSDIEGSTRLWERHGSAMEGVLAGHDQLASSAVTDSGGLIFKHTGDGLVAAFHDPEAAIDAAVAMQRALASTEWHTVGRLRARMGVHSGVAQHRDGDYFGRTVNRCARLMSVAHGGQIVVSGATEALLDRPDSRSWSLIALGLHQLKDLSQPEQIYQVESAGLAHSFPKLNTVDTHPRSLPRVRGPSVGRHKLADTMQRRLASDRLCSLVGPGGVGKSRVAIDVAEQMLAGFPDGVWFCSVKDLTTAEAMAAAIAEVLRIDIADPSRAIPMVLSALGDRAAMLIIDGCEAAPDAACDLIEDLLDSCPTVRLVATSRERLRLRIGQLVVDPLEVPSSAEAAPEAIGLSPAVELFMGRAQGTSPEFELTAENAGTVAEICRRLDGLPLALELAAGQIATLDPADILARLERHVALKPRQGPTVEAVVSWSYESLDANHQRLFARLSVFDAGFDLAAAEAICTDKAIGADEVGFMLTNLVDKSLLATRRDGGSIRFRLLSLLRRFAGERLAEFGLKEPTEAKHFAYYRAFAGVAAAGLAGREEATWVDAFETEFANLRAAFWSASSAGRFHDAATLVWLTYSYAFGRTRYEIAEWAETAVDGLGDDLGEHGPELLTIVGWGFGVRGDVTTSSRFAREAVALARSQGRDPYVPHRLLIVGSILRGDLEQAAVEVMDAKASLRHTPDPRAAIDMLGFEAFTMAMSGRPSDAIACIDEALIQARATGNPSLIAWCLYESGVIEANLDSAAAGTALDHALELAELVKNRYITG
ncbi:MAG: adenylate/guanylate cyclase domain-containing protein, partial [Acidimicrobiales bacterium]|nr:adenylate/guanylate cyclase domain-containing protein [Acidimicrobiales bacterium]